MINKNSFWRWNNKNIPATCEDIEYKEKEIWFKLPSLYKELMKICNWWYILPTTYFDQNNQPKLMFFSGFDKIEYVQSFYDVVFEYMYEDEIIEAMNKFTYCFPKRLIVFASNNWHDLICFDYWWMQKDLLLEPKILYLEQYYDDLFWYSEKISIKNFDILVNWLKYSWYQCEAIYVWINYDWKIDNFIEIFSKNCWWEYKKNENFNEYIWSINNIGVIIYPNSKNKNNHDFDKYDIIVKFIYSEIYYDYSNYLLFSEKVNNFVFKMKNNLLDSKILLIPHFYKY